MAVNQADQSRAPANQTGQTLVIAAVLLFALVVVFLFTIQVAQMLNQVNYVADTVRFAAEVAARPSGSTLVGGALHIDPDEAEAAARAQLALSLQQGSVANPALVLESAVVEFVNPPAGACGSFPDDDACYYTPAVRVSAAVPITLLGLTVTIRRSGVATTSATPASGSLPAPVPMPTPIILPTEVFIITP
jgi:hypothetical protein